MPGLLDVDHQFVLIPGKIPRDAALRLYSVDEDVEGSEGAFVGPVPQHRHVLLRQTAGRRDDLRA